PAVLPFSTVFPRETPLGQFEACLRFFFPSCEDPLGDLCRAICLWKEIRQMIIQLNVSIDACEIKDDIDAA
ncbi:xpg n-terminal domain-containing protein, partial [Cystoisospora suis]